MYKGLDDKYTIRFRQWLLCSNPATRTLVDLWSMIVASPGNEDVALRKRKCRSSLSPSSLSLSVAPPVQRALRHDYANCMQLQSLCVTVRRSRCRSIDKDLQMERALPATLINRPLLIRPDHLHRDIIAEARSPSPWYKISRSTGSETRPPPIFPRGSTIPPRGPITREYECRGSDFESEGGENASRTKVKRRAKKKLEGKGVEVSRAFNFV